MNPIIKVEGLGKQYRIGARQASYGSLRDSLAGLVRAPLRRLQNGQGSRPKIWALRDANFEVAPGEVVGIIGRNGAGKSTLLKLLSHITEPTTGNIQLYGRIASLLEVGTGFHAELSGRENIFLNGAILGMARKEIGQKFDEIVAFAEVEKFIDTPVKFYSTGMYLRLAFAVAAHLEPEILLVDEVLAVGDANFQKKCLNKMEDVGRHGRTILFVSHNMTAMTRLCPRIILLDNGRIQADGPAQRIVADYLNSRLERRGHLEWANLADAPGNQIVRLRSARVRMETGETKDIIDIRESVGIEIEFEVLESGHVLVPNFPFFNEHGVCMFHVPETDPAWRRRPRPKGHYRSTVWIPGNFLSEGTVLVGLAISTLNPVQVHFYEQEALAFEVVETGEGESVRGDYQGQYPGVIRPMLNWTTEYSGEENVRGPVAS